MKRGAYLSTWNPNHVAKRRYEILDGTISRVEDSHLDRLLIWIKRPEVDGGRLLDFWKRNGQVDEWIESDRDPIASRTLETGFELSVEKVHEDRVVSERVVAPGFISDFDIASSVRFDDSGLRLSLDAIQVLVESIKQER